MSSSSSSTFQVSFFPPKPRFSFQSFPSQHTSWAERVKEKVKSVQYISPYMKYLLVLTQHLQAGVDRRLGSPLHWKVWRQMCCSERGNKLFPPRTTHCLAIVMPLLTFISYILAWAQIDRGIAVCEGMSGLVDHGRFQMTSLPNSLREEREVLCCCRSQCLLAGNRQNVRKFCCFYSESYT